jgi:hypothetical protein
MNTATTVQRTTVEASTPDPTPEAAPVPSTQGDAVPPVSSDTSTGAASGGPDLNLEMARRLEGVSKKEARARKAEAELHAARAAFEADQKKLSAKLAELDDALGDPVGHMLKNGKDPVEVARRFATPETPIEKEVRLLKEERAAEKAEAAKRAEEYEASRTEAQRADTVRSFVRGINPDEHPYLVASYSPEAIPELVSNLLNRRLDPSDPDGETVHQAFYREHKRDPTDVEIRESLESMAEERATKIVKSHQARALAQSQASDTSQAPAKTASGPSGISNQHASVTTSGKKRPPTLEEKRKAMRKELTEALEAEATDRT